MLDRAGNDNELVNSTRQDGKTALGIACVYERVHIVRFLLDKGADVNQPDTAGYTPLIYAVMNRTPKVILQLLDNNADPNMATGRPGDVGITPMCIAIQNGDIRTVQILLRAGATDTQDMECFQAACAKNRPDIVEELLNSPNLTTEAIVLLQNSFRNRAFGAAALFLFHNYVSAAFDIFNTHGLPLNGDFDFITPHLHKTTLLHICLDLTRTHDFSRAQAVQQALEMGADPTYPIPLDQAGTDRISPLAYALREPGMDLSSVFLLYRACSGLGPVSL